MADVASVCMFPPELSDSLVGLVIYINKCINRVCGVMSC